jgi:hypothetical protein
MGGTNDHVGLILPLKLEAWGDNAVDAIQLDVYLQYHIVTQSWHNSSEGTY